MKTITKLTVFFLSLSLLLNGCVSSNDKTQSPAKEDQTAKDDSYSVVVFDPVVFKDNKANKEPNTPKEIPFTLCGTELVAKRQYSDPIKDDHFMSWYNKYYYECDEEKIRLRYNSLGNFIYFLLEESSRRTYEQIAQDYLGSVTTLTQDECVQKCFELLNDNSVDTRGFKAEEVSFDEEKHIYNVKLQGYIEDIPTIEVAKFEVTDFGLVYSYSGEYVGNTPYYEENPFDMKKVRYEVMKGAHELLIPGEDFKREYDELEITILEYEFNCVPDKGIALYVSVTAYLYDNSGEFPDRVSGSWIMTLVVLL